MHSNNNPYNPREKELDSEVRVSSLEDDLLYPHGNLMTYTNLVAPLYATEQEVGMQHLGSNLEMVTDGADIFPLNDFDDSDEWDLDLAYLRSIFPLEAKKILAIIDDELDKLEYAGSVMFDQYPDKNHLALIIDGIYRKVEGFDKENTELRAEIQSLEPLFGPGPCPGGFCPPFGSDFRHRRSDFDRRRSDFDRRRSDFDRRRSDFDRRRFDFDRDFDRRRFDFDRDFDRRRFDFDRDFRRDSREFRRDFNENTTPNPPCQGRNCQPPIPYYFEDGKPNWLRNLTEVMVYGEIQNRRRRYRDRNTW